MFQEKRQVKVKDAVIASPTSNTCFLIKRTKKPDEIDAISSIQSFEK